MVGQLIEFTLGTVGLMREDEELRVQGDEEGEPRRRAETTFNRMEMMNVDGVSRGKSRGSITTAMDTDETKRTLTWWTFSGLV
jgi:hypothetical protein